ncbi:MAG: hypothetical protein CSA22_10385 [Deltaproteobacteria bacterium]|nr:MAG: hypothetical protein CSA22_10385 [Deltaproteobacteria bacterium]
MAILCPPCGYGFRQGVRIFDIDHMIDLTDTKLYTLENVWQTLTPEQQADVIDFWERTGLLPKAADATERSRQVVFIVRDHRRQIVGVCSVYRQFVRRLTSQMLMFRTLIDKPFRRSGIGLELLKKTRDFFNARFIDGTDTDCIGLMVILENRQLNAVVRRAVCPRTGFIFIGLNDRGQQMRVFYFDNAKIGADAPV